ncbi:translocation protein SEC63 homolog [Tribolium castaneum]|uniref:Translocation protein SEC63 homolog-like Protein n=1 Tax=Tribolium castaneum TaxID=7070 RepID=D6WNC7_TRICA|nr:PREDICTED: translocation protein SEC63 homolog [Tribolium castaneum]EFA04351.2 Translocation protein SEC63 homolog-like Protein [Tribolium castaneum]|eukprot:XP_971689.1 PREDICTED: translocation protein SEC63 homolog [Tribolium castaneum]
MGQKFQYDESGSTFFYFLLSFLALILIPATIYYWPREKKRDPEEESKKCHCPPCIKKREFQKNADPWKGPKNFLIKLVIIIGWLLLLLLAYKVSQFDYEMANFDPYEILGIPLGASQAEIKKAYRRLSLILHPDKDTGNEKEFMKLSKAYQALTDDEARKNWEKYGNPDGPGAMSFGIALPSWIVEKENSVWVLGLYGLVFMVALPIVVGTWWYRSIKFTDQVLLDTTQMYYYFFHKTPNMVLKRVIMILAASLEFNKKHNSEIKERDLDNEEVPQLIKKLPNLSEKNKEAPLCYTYSIKARAIIHAHLSRIPLNPNTLEEDRRYIIAKCPTLIQEQVNCVNQLIVLAYNRRIQRLPTIETIENCMKLCPMIVQGLWEFKSPLLQLPYINEDNLKYFMNKKKPIRSLQQFAQLKGDERRNILRNFSEQEYDNVMKVLGNMPYIDFQVKYEVMDDENPTEVTVGAIVTVIVTLTRKPMSTLFGDETVKDNNLINENGVDGDAKEAAAGDTDPQVPVIKRPAWLKQKRGGGKKNKKPVKQPKATAAVVKPKADESPVPSSDKKKVKEEKSKEEESEESDVSDAETNDKSSEDDSVQKSQNEDDDQEWEKFKKLHEREKALQGKSKTSHPVHSPYFPNDKQEYWWTYICDRKSRTLLTVPHYVTSLIDQEVVHLKFTAPNWVGVYTFTVCLRSDSYIGFDQQKDIKLDVKAAPAEITEHPQWEDLEEEEGSAKEDAHESEYTTDEDLSEDDD